MQFVLKSIKGESVPLENGGFGFKLGIHAPAIVEMAHKSALAGNREGAEEIIVAGWPALPLLAVRRIINGEYSVKESDVIVDVPEIVEKED